MKTKENPIKEKKEFKVTSKKKKGKGEKKEELKRNKKKCVCLD